MQCVHKSPTLTVHYDERDFFVLEVADGQEKSLSELQKAADALLANGIKSIRVLVARDNSYSTHFDVLTADLQNVNGLIVEKVAYFAPTSSAQSSSRLEAAATLKNVNWQIFPYKDAAIAWLIEP